MTDDELAKVLQRGAVPSSPPPIDRVLDAPRRRARSGIAIPATVAIAIVLGAVLVISTRSAPNHVAPVPTPGRSLDGVAMSLPGTPDLFEADRIAQRILAIRTEPKP